MGSCSASLLVSRRLWDLSRGAASRRGPPREAPDAPGRPLARPGAALTPVTERSRAAGGRHPGDEGPASGAARREGLGDHDLISGEGVADQLRIAFGGERDLVMLLPGARREPADAGNDLGGRGYADLV